jgi:transcription antitermination factor NusG
MRDKDDVQLAQLKKATRGEVDETPRPATPPPFEIGQAVRIKPGVLQAKTGRITRIGKDPITVNDAKIAHSPKNLTLIALAQEKERMATDPHRKGEPWGVLMLNQVKRPCA